MKFYTLQIDIDAPRSIVFGLIKTIGGNNGWYYANWIWRLRGLIDRMIGGIGFRKGRSSTNEIEIGDQIDFWRVQQFVQNEKLELYAEMNTFGEAFLQFNVGELPDGKSRLEMHAKYTPNGMFGEIYWILVYPLHIIVFNGLIRKIKTLSENSVV